MMFKSLPVGAVFEFDHSDLGFFSDLASGPWRKVSARKYHHVTYRPQDTYEVGTVKVAVIPIERTTPDVADDPQYTPDQTFQVGDRVEIHPGCDLWMRGAKYGTIARRVNEKLHGTVYYVRMDNARVRRLQRLQADRLRKVE